MRWINVWIQREWGGYMYEYLEGVVGTGMDTN